ncbi:helix-turn-helix domain-containing protein [Halobacteriales archaeon Cl-PHB]
MHQFVVEHDAYDRTRLLYRENSGADHAGLFHVEGPADPYAERLQERESVHEFALSRCADESFYLYVYEAIPAVDRPFAAAFGQPGLLVLTPIDYCADGTVQVTAVGPAEGVQRAVDAVPETMGITVDAVGSFVPGRVDARLELTQRQLEAVAAAVETGYYSEPRAATLDDVATELDCSSGTAGELLRRAERTVMADLLDAT